MDRPFKVVKVPMASRQVAARYAVYKAFRRRRMVPRRPSLSLMDQLVSAASRAWRDLVMRLSCAGWHRAADKKDMQYLRNCPPSGVVTDDATNRCDTPLLCPFCHGRRVASLFDAMERAIWDGKAMREPVKLVQFSASMHVGDFAKGILRRVHAQGQQDSTEGAMRIAFERARINADQKGRRSTEFDAIRKHNPGVVVSGFVFQRISMYKDLPILKRTGVMILPVSADIDFGIDQVESLRCKVHDKVTRGVLASLVGTNCRQSAGWLKRGENRTLHALCCLRAFSHARMLATYGKAYGPPPAPPKAENGQA